MLYSDLVNLKADYLLVKWALPGNQPPVEIGHSYELKPYTPQIGFDLPLPPMTGPELERVRGISMTEYYRHGVAIFDLFIPKAMTTVKSYSMYRYLSGGLVDMGLGDLIMERYSDESRRPEFLKARTTIRGIYVYSCETEMVESPAISYGMSFDVSMRLYVPKQADGQIKVEYTTVGVLSL